MLRRLAARTGRPLLEVTADDLAAWCARLPRRLSRGSVGTYIGHVLGFYEWAARQGLVPASPAAGLRRPRVTRKRPAKPLPDGALTAALEAADPQLRAAVALMGFCGLRAGEVAALRAADVPAGPGELLRVSPGRHGQARWVPLPPVVFDALRGLGISAGVVFRGQDGQPYTASRLNAKVGVHMRRLGIAGAGHRLRSTYLASARGGGAKHT